jgi:hypothetical protein
MGYTAPTYTNWDTGGHVVSANIDTDILDNIVYLKSAADSRAVAVEVFEDDIPLSTGTLLRILGPMPSLMAGYNLTKVTATVFAKSTSGTPTVEVLRGRQTTPGTAHAWWGMLSTLVTIDENEYSSLDATVPPVVSTSYDDIAEGDLLGISVTVAGTGATGLWAVMEFVKP